MLKGFYLEMVKRILHALKIPEIIECCCINKAIP